jgi:acyl dehydratase
VDFQGTLVQPEDTITSITTVADKLERNDGSRLVLRVSSHNQRGEPVADYHGTYILEST